MEERPTKQKKQKPQFVEDRLINYKIFYENKTKKRKEALMDGWFWPKTNRKVHSSRLIMGNLALPLKKKRKKAHMTKTQRWIEKEKKRLQKELEEKLSQEKAKQKEEMLEKGKFSAVFKFVFF